MPGHATAVQLVCAAVGGIAIYKIYLIYLDHLSRRASSAVSHYSSVEEPSGKETIAESDPVIVLDVGGVLMKTRRSTLTMGSLYFENMFSSRFKQPGQAVFLDCDAEAFGYVLNYMRHKVLDRAAPLHRVKHIAKMFCIDELLEKIEMWERLKIMVGTWINMDSGRSSCAFHIVADPPDDLMLICPDLRNMFDASTPSVALALANAGMSSRKLYYCQASGEDSEGSEANVSDAGSLEEDREYYFFEVSIPQNEENEEDDESDADYFVLSELRLTVVFEPASHENDEDAHIVGNQRSVFVCSAVAPGKPRSWKQLCELGETAIREEHNNLDWTIECVAIRSEVTSFGVASTQCSHD